MQEVSREDCILKSGRAVGGGWTISLSVFIDHVFYRT